MSSGQTRVIIVSGGHLGAWALAKIRSEDYLIGADRGALFLVDHGFRPDLAVGDFDSVSEEERVKIAQNSVEFISCDPVMKDESDTELAFIHATQRKPSEIVIVGAVGSRYDHSLANIHLLRRACLLNIPCSIIDEFNIIRATDGSIEVEAVEGYPHISLLPLTLEVTGVTLTGFQYPLTDATLTLGRSISISNVLSASVGHIQIQSGLLLIIQCRD